MAGHVSFLATGPEVFKTATGFVDFVANGANGLIRYCSHEGKHHGVQYRKSAVRNSRVMGH